MNNHQLSQYSVAYAISKGWLPGQPVPTQQELVAAIKGLFDVMPISLLNNIQVVDAITRARDLMKRVPA